MNTASERDHPSRKRKRRVEETVAHAFGSDDDGLPRPRGWVRASLAQVARINPPLQRPINGADTQVNFVPMRAVEPAGGGLLRPEVKTYAQVKKGYTPFESGDVIMAKITPCMENGKTTVVPELPGGVFFGSTEFHVIRAEKDVDPRWIAHYLLQQSVRQAAQRHMTGGVGQMRVPAAFLETLELPIAPAAEQQRIADTLDKILSGLDAGTAAQQRARSKLGHYRAAVLKAAVAGKLVPGQPAAVEQELGTLVDTIYQGWSPKCEGMHSDDPEVWAVIKTTAVQPMRFLPSENKRLPSTSSPRPHLQLKEGDLLMTRAGPRARAGVTCMVRQSRPKLMLCDKTYLIRCDNSKVIPAFLEVCLNAPQILDAIDSLKTGISDSGVNLTQTRLKKLVLPLPGISEQQVVVEAVEDQLSVIEHLETELDAKLQSAQALRQSILRHAFAGKLVPQDPTDEPAGELLKRIAAERADRALQAPSRKRLGRKAK